MFPEKAAAAAAAERKRTRASYTEQDISGSRSPGIKLAIYRRTLERKNLSYGYTLRPLVAWDENKDRMGGAAWSGSQSTDYRTKFRQGVQELWKSLDLNLDLPPPRND